MPHSESRFEGETISKAIGKKINCIADFIVTKVGFIKIALYPLAFKQGI